MNPRYQLFAPLSITPVSYDSKFLSQSPWHPQHAYPCGTHMPSPRPCFSRQWRFRYWRHIFRLSIRFAFSRAPVSFVSKPPPPPPLVSKSLLRLRSGHQLPRQQDRLLWHLPAWTMKLIRDYMKPLGDDVYYHASDHIACYKEY